MTKIITDQLQQSTGGQEIVVHPTDSLMNLVVALLAPMFRSVTAGDTNLARMAAAEAMNAYCTQSHADVIAVAQIIGLALRH